MDRKL